MRCNVKSEFFFNNTKGEAKGIGNTNGSTVW